jgi:hypothetical protein
VKVVWLQASKPLGLRPGVTLPLVLEHQVFDGFHSRPGPHRVGVVETYEDGRLLLKVLPTAEGKTAQAMLAEGLLDVAVEGGTVWLGVWSSG